jgi:ATP-dependent helicase/nuclease subunit B
MTTTVPGGTAAVLAAAEQGATIITANNRSARGLLDAYDRLQRERGAAAWRTPDIVSWNGFILRLWNEALYSGCTSHVLLNGAQQRRMWQQIVSSENNSWLNPAAAADNAEHAWDTAMQYSVPLENPLYNSRAETRAFAKWAALFKQECRRNGWLDRASLPDALLSHIRAGRLRSCKRIVLVGFDQTTPQQQSLLNALLETGARCEYVEQLNAAEGAACVLDAEDADAEIRAAAAWARRKLESNPDISIAIVVPSLESLRTRIETIFLATLHPEQLPAGSPNRRRAFELSIGVSLAEYPVIAAALLVLKLSTCGLSLQETGVLLRSPFLAGADTEITARARLDALLRKHRILEVTVETLRDQAFQRCPVLHTRLKTVSKIAAALHAYSPRKWSEFSAEILTAAGWPERETGLSSEEYQAVEAWTKLLGEFGSLDSIEPVMDASRFFTQLSDCAMRTAFEPEKAGAPVQIMGMLEAAGSSFDAMWVMGLHDEAWPARSAATPFIPIELQLRHGVPHASAEAEVVFAEKIRDRLVRSACEIIFSFPRKDGDMQLRPSPLLKKFERKEIAEVSGGAVCGWSEALFASSKSESFCDESGPEIAEGTVVKGGTKILERQSACPFRAFAELRLGATEMDSPQPGLDGLQRGNIVHQAMEFIWNRVKNQQNLLECKSLNELVVECVTKAIEVAEINRDAEWEQRLADIERDRVTRLILGLLDIEKTRAPFTVAEEEQKRQVALGGLQMDTRIDRIDRLQDGRQVLIDYKTGEVNTKSWEENRPESPQMPAYAATLAGEIAAVTFAQIKAGTVGFSGYSPDSQIIEAGEYSKTIPGKAGETLPDVVLRWKVVVERLAREYREGRAEVDPAKETTCDYCPLPALCRISQRNLVKAGEESGNEQ